MDRVPLKSRQRSGGSQLGVGKKPSNDPGLSTGSRSSEPGGQGQRPHGEHHRLGRVCIQLLGEPPHPVGQEMIEAPRGVAKGAAAATPGVEGQRLTRAYASGAVWKGQSPSNARSCWGESL